MTTGGSDAACYMLDYGAGNVRSVVNAAREMGYELKLIQSPEDFDKAQKLIFPGVGSFGACMGLLKEKGYFEPLKQYIASGRPYFGICIGLQALFDGRYRTEKWCSCCEGEGQIKLNREVK